MASKPPKNKRDHKAYAERHRERLRAYHKSYYQDHREETRARSKQWYLKNRDKVRARLSTPEERKKAAARSLAYYRANTEKIKEYHRQRRRRPEYKKRRKAYERVYRELNREKLRAYYHAYYLAHREEYKERDRARRRKRRLQQLRDQLASFVLKRDLRADDPDYDPQTDEFSHLVHHSEWDSMTDTQRWGSYSDLVRECRPPDDYLVQLMEEWSVEDKTDMSREEFFKRGHVYKRLYKVCPSLRAGVAKDRAKRRKQDAEYARLKGWKKRKSVKGAAHVTRAAKKRNSLEVALV